MKWVKRHISLTLFLVVLIVGIILAPHAGVTWDEPDNIFAGGVYVTFFKEGLNPHAFDGFWDERSYFRSAISTLNPTISHYPPVPNYVGSLLTIFAQAAGYVTKGWQIIITFHWATVFFLALLVATVYRFGLLIGLSPSTSLFAALATYLYPAMFGHGLTDLKDTAQVSLFTLSLYYLVRGSTGKGRGVKDIVTGGVVWGLGLATKFNAVYVPIIWGTWEQCQMIHATWPIKKQLRHIFRFIIGHLSLVIVVGIATMYLVWPYLWLNPIGHLKEMVEYFMTVGRGYAVVWNGVLYTVGTGKSLWWYPWGSLLVTTPPVLLLFGIIGAVRVIREKDNTLTLLLIWILVPLLRTLSPWTAFYDELRHFLEIVPAMMLIAGLTLEWISRRWSRVAVVLGTAAVGQLLWVNVLLFPYSTGYYNFLAHSANQNFDRDIEGLSIKEGIDWAHARYGHIRVFVPIAGHLSWYYLASDDMYVIDPGAADTVILMNKASHSIDTQYKEFEASKGDFTLVHTIMRGDAVFGWVYRRK